MYEQVMPFADCFLSRLLCGYRKANNTQYALLKFLETCKMTMDNECFAGALSMDLSKAFDCLNHELPLAKLHASGFNRNSLALFHSCLSKRRQRVKNIASCSKWNVNNLGVALGSVLGPLLLNMYINDIFVLMKGTKIRKFSDDATLYSCDYEVKNVIISLEQDPNRLTEWFQRTI